MPIIDGTPGMVSCPNCGNAAPYNFRLEQRVTMKQPDPQLKPGLMNVTSTKTVYACINCGTIIQDLP